MPSQGSAIAYYMLFSAPAVLMIQLHSATAMRLHLRLAGTKNYFAVLRYFTLDWTLDYAAH